MRFGLRRLVSGLHFLRLGGGHAAATLLGGLFLFAQAEIAHAIRPFDGFTCTAGSTNSLSKGPFPKIGASKADIHIDAGETLKVEVTGGTTGAITREGAPIVSLPLDASESLSGPLDSTLVVPAPGIAGGSVSVTFTCTPGPEACASSPTLDEEQDRLTKELASLRTEEGELLDKIAFAAFTYDKAEKDFFITHKDYVTVRAHLQAAGVSFSFPWRETDKVAELDLGSQEVRKYPPGIQEELKALKALAQTGQDAIHAFGEAVGILSDLESRLGSVRFLITKQQEELDIVEQAQSCPLPPGEVLPKPGEEPTHYSVEPQ